ncbi:group II truncated hemoglobin [Pigmentiphaga soli]|uniref:Group II truncated hemoglobin n=1 Tax=Pigmentiphaga soli TaxID=1007095 RepID=A0ABP8GPW0_9BURK
MQADNNTSTSPAATAEPAVTIFERIGGEEKVRALVDRFYDLMDLDDDLAELRAAHGPSLDNARNKLFWFLCGWMGGPDHYISRFGHPRLRARHLPFSIGRAERDQWVVCMGRAMQDVGVEPALAERLLGSFYETADWMRNRQEAP